MLKVSAHAESTRLSRASRVPASRFTCEQRSEVTTYHARPHRPSPPPRCAHLLGGVGVDELAADAAGLGLGGGVSVVLAGQPELEVLLAVFGPQELPEGLKTT